MEIVTEILGGTVLYMILRAIVLMVWRGRLCDRLNELASEGYIIHKCYGWRRRYQMFNTVSFGGLLFSFRGFREFWSDADYVAMTGPCQCGYEDQ